MAGDKSKSNVLDFSAFFLKADRKCKLVSKVNKDDCNTVTYGQEMYDINHLVKLYTQQGYTQEDFARIAQDMRRTGQYLDVRGLDSLDKIEDRMTQLNEFFCFVPPDVRAQFDNDAYKFFQFASNPLNEKQLLSYLKGSKMMQDFPKVPQQAPVADSNDGKK